MFLVSYQPAGPAESGSTKHPPWLRCIVLEVVFQKQACDEY